MEYRIEHRTNIHLDNGKTIPPYIVYDEDNTVAFYGVTEQECQEWINSHAE